MRRIVLAALCVICLSCDSASPTAPTPACTYSLSATAFSFQAQGGSGSVTVTAGNQCSWTATSQSGWLSITGGGSGTGTAVVTFSATANATSGTRAGTLSVAGLAVSVSQAGASAPCEYAVSANPTSFSKDAGTGTVVVSAAPSCAWSASTSVPWLTVTAGGQGSGNGTVSFAVSRNTEIPDRRSGIVVAAQTIEITQAGDIGGCQYSVAPIEFNVCMTVPVLTTTITTQASCPWTASSGVPWMTVTSGQSGSGTGAIQMSVSDNWAAARDGVVMVRWPTPTAGQNLRVFQAGCTYAVNPATFNIGAAGGSFPVSVYQFSSVTCGGPTQDACLWTVQADVPWITVSRSTGKGDDLFTFTAAANTTGASRNGSIQVRDKTVAIFQAAQ